MTEHTKRTNAFEQLIAAYPHQLNRLNDDNEILDWELFQMGKGILYKETVKLGPTLIAMMLKRSFLESGFVNWKISK